MKEQKLFVGVVPEKSLEFDFGGAFRGVFQLGLLSEIRRADTGALPAEGGSLSDLKTSLREVAEDCADGLAGIGHLLYCINIQPEITTLASLGGLIENLGKLAGEALGKVEALEFEERAARREEDKVNLSMVRSKKKPGNGGDPNPGLQAEAA